MHKDEVEANLEKFRVFEKEMAHKVGVSYEDYSNIIGHVLTFGLMEEKISLGLTLTPCFNAYLITNNIIDADIKLINGYINKYKYVSSPLWKTMNVVGE
jgi:hypothetical protein